MRAVDHIAQSMKKRGLRLWTFPGGTIYPLYDACHQAGVETVVLRSEFGAGYAAIGAAKATGDPQVVAVTSGPGATNLVTPIADAYYDSVPIVGLCGQVGLKYLDQTGQRQRGFQQTPIAEIMKPITKGVSSGTHNLPDVFEWALTIANEGRRGPVVIDMPMDVQKAEDEVKGVVQFQAYLPTHRSSDMERLIDLLHAAQRPIIIAGAGCKDAHYLLSEFTERTRIPVVASLPAVGIIHTNREQYLGMIGHTGHPSANLAVHQADLVIALGTRLDVRQTGTLTDRFAPGAKVVRVDIDHAELTNSSVVVDLTILAHCRGVLQDLVNRFNSDKHWDYGMRTLFNSSSAQVVQYISSHAPAECAFVTGVGSHQQHAARSLTLCHPRRQFITSAGHGCMGAGLPMAIGAALAAGKPAVLIDGDGSFQMSLPELASIDDLGLQNLIEIHVIDNASGGLVSQFARLQGWDPSETTWFTPNLAAIEEAYNVAIHVHKVQEEGVWPILEAGHEMDDMTEDPTTC